MLWRLTKTHMESETKRKCVEVWFVPLLYEWCLRKRNCVHGLWVCCGWRQHFVLCYLKIIFPTEPAKSQSMAFLFVFFHVSFTADIQHYFILVSGELHSVRRLYNLWSDHPGFTSTCLTLYVVIRVLLTRFPTLYFTSSWLSCNQHVVRLQAFTCFTQPPSPLPSGNHHFVLCTYQSVSVLLFFLEIPHTSEVIWYLPFSVWPVFLRITPSKSTHVVTNGDTFPGRVASHSIHVPPVVVCCCCCCWRCFPVLTQLSIEWQPGCSPIGAVVNRAAVDIWMRMSFEIRVLDFFR